ncbi:site-specific DNA-methyltransferase [Microbacterium sp. X-17]|uniref:DNA-methyltransferase n=1 Tax=Microbacterium sp. X-17 TaxID=3144404 RepID=UPI0031F5C8E7
MSNAPFSKLFVGDAGFCLRQFPDHSVDMVLTSPPYANGLRNYGVKGQLGQEASVGEWVDNVVTALEPLQRVLTEQGTLWLNVDDSYSRTPGQGAPRKGLLLGPERLAIALSEHGWIVRNKLVWKKSNGLPTAVTDRLRHQWEAVYVLARSPRYFFDLDAVRVPHESRPPKRKDTHAPRNRPDAWQGRYGDRGDGLKRNRALGKVGHDLGKNPGDVWTIPVSNGHGGHHATFPLGLAERSIQAGCPELVCLSCQTPWRRKVVHRLGTVAVRSGLGQMCHCDDTATRPGIVLDPFMGSGTTAVAAEKLGRDWRGIELNPHFARMAEYRIIAARNGEG